MSHEMRFDCVEMKNQIQAQLLHEYKGLSSEEARRRRIDKLISGNSPAAKIWQEAVKHRKSVPCP